MSRGYGAVLAAATLWALNGTFTRFLFTEVAVPPLVLIQVRLVLSFGLLLLGLAVAKPALLKVPKGQLPYLVILGIFGLLPMQALYSLTISLTNVATAIFLEYLAPVLAALWAWLATRQRPSRLLLVALALSTAGTALLLLAGGQLTISPAGLTTGLLSAVAMAFYSIWGSRPHGLNPWTVSLYAYGFASLITLGFGSPFSAGVSPLGWLSLLLVALFGTILPFGLYFVGLSQVPPERALIVATLEPVLAALFAYLLLHEVLGVGQIIGSLFIAVAAILVQRKEPGGNIKRATLDH